MKYNIKCLCTDTEYKCNTSDTFEYCINKKKLLFFCPYLHFLDKNYNTKVSLINNIKTTHLTDRHCVNIIKFTLSVNHNFIRIFGSYYMIFTNIHIFNKETHQAMMNKTIMGFKNNIFTQSDENLKILVKTFKAYIVEDDLMQLKFILENWLIMLEKIIM